ncbi:hypothetical protein Bca101_022344 [Brassica carinata]
MFRNSSGSSRRRSSRVVGILEEREHDEKKTFERLEMKLEKEIFERVEAALVETKESVKRMCVVVVIGCVMLIALTKFIG